MSLDNLKLKYKSSDKYINHETYLNPKLEFLFENYSNKKTIHTYWNLFKERILPVELDYGKDLYEFSKDEIEQMMLSNTTSSKRVKNSIGTLASLYIDWAIKIKKFKNGINPFEELNFQELLKVNKKVLKDEYISWDEMFNMAERAKIKGMSYQDICVLLLSRAGLYGKDGLYLKELRVSNIKQDVDKIMIMDEETGEIITQIPVLDDRIYEWIWKAIQEYSFITKVKNTTDMHEGEMREVILYERDSRVLKSRNEDMDTINSTMIFGARQEFFDINGMKSLGGKKLVKCAKIDLLDTIAKETGCLTIEDFKKVQKVFEPNSTESAYYKLKEDYILIRPNVKIIKKNTNGKYLTIPSH